MRKWFTYIVSLFALCVDAQSDDVLFDSFNTGGFSLTNQGPFFDVDPIQFLVNRRRVDANGNPNWSALLNSNDGILHYEVKLRDPVPEETTYLLLDYRNTNNALFSIAEFDAFAFQITEVTGGGYIRVSVNGLNVSNSLPELITQPGTVYYPLHNMTVQPYQNPVISVQIYFFPLNGDLSTAVDQITLVPEPCSAFLFASATTLLVARRSRQRPRSP